MSNPSPVVATSRKIRCPDCSPPIEPFLEHLLEDVAVAHLGRGHRDARVHHRAMEPEVRHHRRDDRVVRQRPRLLHRDRARGEDLVAVDRGTLVIDEQCTVRVAVVRHPGVGAERHDGGARHLGCSAPQSTLIFRAPSGDAQVAWTFAPSRRSRLQGDLGGGPVRAVDHERRNRPAVPHAPRRWARYRSRPPSETGDQTVARIRHRWRDRRAPPRCVLDPVGELRPIGSREPSRCTRGLCEAEMATPASAQPIVEKAIAGVGSTPTPEDVAAGIVGPSDERFTRARRPSPRGSRPTRNTGRSSACSASTATAAQPSPRASSVVSSEPATPRTPSVPKRRAMGR